MFVSPIDEKTGRSLSRSGETEKADEKEETDGADEMAEEGEEEESCEGSRSVGRKSPKEPTESEKKRPRADTLPL